MIVKAKEKRKAPYMQIQEFGAVYGLIGCLLKKMSRASPSLWD
jgi:hypothetical protein